MFLVAMSRRPRRLRRQGEGSRRLFRMAKVFQVSCKMSKAVNASGVRHQDCYHIRAGCDHHFFSKPIAEPAIILSFGAFILNPN